MPRLYPVRTALAHPGVTLTLSHNGRRVHDLPAGADRLAESGRRLHSAHFGPKRRSSICRGRRATKGAPPDGGYDGTLDGGFDVYKSFTPNLVGVVSTNMDFAETEADERRINLTRFPLFFPEKRMFFLEGSETFSSSSSVSFTPFFSRKVGLYQGRQIPILFGAKLYGKAG